MTSVALLFRAAAICLEHLRTNGALTALDLYVSGDGLADMGGDDAVDRALLRFEAEPGAALLLGRHSAYQ